MPHTGYNSDYYTTAYLVYMEDSSVSDNYIVDDWSIYFDAAPPADGQLTEVVTGETGVSTGMEGSSLGGGGLGGGGGIYP